jgi:Uma2 family endonuclease
VTRFGGLQPPDRIGPVEAVAYTPFEAYLEAERDSLTRHEFVAGRLFALAGASHRHDVIVSELHRRLADGARARNCRSFAHNRLVRTRCGNAYYPDLVVICGPPPNDLYDTDPALVVEVLSPSTTAIDRREKPVAYAEAPSLQMLWLVEPYERKIEVARPAGGRIREWEAFGPGHIIITPWGDVPVDDLYDEVDRLAPMP